jgi:hypothetical protein
MEYKKDFVVAIPVPFLDRAGRKLDAVQIDRWTQKVQRVLTRCFGGATVSAANAPGMWTAFPDRETGKPQKVYEEKQTLVEAACADKVEFLRHRRRIRALVVRMGRSLDQCCVFVLARASESFLIEIEYREKAKSRFHRDRSRRRSGEKGARGNRSG